MTSAVSRYRCARSRSWRSDRLRLFAFEHLVFELFRTLKRGGRKREPLVNAADLPRQRHDQMFIVLGEGPALVPDETDPSVDMGR